VACPCTSPGAPTPPPAPTPNVCGSCGSSNLVASIDCTGFYYCTGGQPGAYETCGVNRLFSQSIQGCDHDYNVACPCTSPGAPTPPPAPTPNVCGSCGSSWLVASIDCGGFYYCAGGQPGAFVSCGVNTLFSESIQGCDWDYRVSCPCTSPGAPTPPLAAPIPPPTPPSAANPTGTDISALLIVV